MNCSSNLNKTVKLNKNNQLKRTLSISKKTKNYLSETISSINKKTVKFDNAKLTPKNSTKSSTKVLNYNAKIYQLYKPKSNVSAYFDNLNHFSNNCDFGNDPFGHFD
jgi:hypothetical protein